MSSRVIIGCAPPGSWSACPPRARSRSAKSNRSSTSASRACSWSTSDGQPGSGALLPRPRMRAADRGTDRSKDLQPARTPSADRRRLRRRSSARACDPPTAGAGRALGLAPAIRSAKSSRSSSSAQPRTAPPRAVAPARGGSSSSACTSARRRPALDPPGDRLDQRPDQRRKRSVPTPSEQHDDRHAVERAGDHHLGRGRLRRERGNRGLEDHRRGSPGSVAGVWPPGQHPLGEVEPLLQLRDPLVQRVHLAEPMLELVHLGPQRGVVRLPFQPARRAPA